MKSKKLIAGMMAAALAGSMMSTVGVQAEEKPFEGQEITFADTGAGSWEEKLEPII